MDKRSKFILFYHDYLKRHDIFRRLSDISENSPWHRESNILVHTDMVVSEYLTRAGENWTTDHIVGALAAAFHDVGKPDAKTKKYNPERGNYYSFPGHGHISARLWEDFVVNDWKIFQSELELLPIDIYRVGWLCENHMPYYTKKRDKVQILVRTARELFPNFPALETLVCADSWGRVSDDHPNKKHAILDWREEFETVELDPINSKVVSGTCYILIGPSGCGKSTFSDGLDATHYSWDDLRLRWYTADFKGDEISRYQAAYTISLSDKNFKTKADKEFIGLLTSMNDVVIDNITPSMNDVVVDNTNLSDKRRRFFITEARRYGYKVIGILFPAARRYGYKVIGILFPAAQITLSGRHECRKDKGIPIQAVQSHYDALVYPHLGDMDEIWVLDSNLPK